MEKKEWEGSFGVSQLDNITLGSIRPGLLGLFYGPSGTGKTSILSHFLFQGARESQNVCLITNEPPARAASRISSFSGYQQKWLKDGYISILNIHDLVGLIGVYLEDIKMGDADLVYDLLVQVVDHLDAKRLVIDPVNPLIDLLETEGTRTFFSGIKDELVQRGANCLMGYDTSRGREEWEQNPLSVHDLDILVRFRKEKEPPLVLNTLTIERWRATAHAKTSYVVDISKDGIILVPRIKPLEVK